MHAFPSSFRRGLTVAVGSAALAVQSSSQSVTLNDPLARELRTSPVPHFLFTADGARVVYKTDREVPSRGELFSRPRDGSAPPVKLNGPMHPNGDVGTWALPDGFALAAAGRVVYVAAETDGVTGELFSVPADGSAARVRLSPAGVSVFPFELDAAGTNVYFHGGSFVPGFGTGPLYRAPVDASAPAVLLTPGVIVRQSWLSPDGGTLVFVSDAPLGRQALHALPSDGSAAPVLLSETHAPAADDKRFMDLVFAPDGRVVYHEVENAFDDPIPRVYSVPLDASQPAVLLNDGPDFVLDPRALPARIAFVDFPALVSTASDGTQPAVLSPAGWMVFDPPLVFGTTVLMSAFLAGNGTLLRAPIDGSLPAVELFPALGNVQAFELANDATVAFVRVVGTERQLAAVPLAGGTPLALHAPAPGGQGARALLPHPDGQRLVFTGDLAQANVQELYVVPLDASSAPLRLNAPLAATDDVLASSVALSPDETHVGFIAGPSGTLGGRQLFVAPVDGSSVALQVNEPALGTTVVGDVTGFGLTPDGTRLVYRADQAADEEFDLYVLESDASTSPLALTLGVPSVLPELAFAPLSERVVFRAQGAQHHLYAAELSGTGALALDSAAWAFGTPFEVSADGLRAVYRRAVSASAFELRSAALDGSSAPVTLHGTLPAGSTVEDFRVGTNGRVAFRADLGASGVLELYTAPVEGGAPALRLNGALVTGGDVTAFELDPHGVRAVFLADARVDTRVELFSARLDGLGAPVRLNGSLSGRGDVTGFAISPDGARVVYRADPVRDQTFELFSVPIGGSPPAHGTLGGVRRPRGVALLTPLPDGRQVAADWKLTPDGATVVYRANVTAGFELFRAPADGSAAPLPLSAPLVAGGTVSSFAVAADQSLVVYAADQRIDDVVELFSVPFEGGPVTALDVLSPFADVSAYRIAPDAAHVVFLADREANGVLELYRVPADGHGPAVKLNRALPTNGDVQADFVALAEGTLYRADQAGDEVFELFLHRWPSTRTGKTRPR